MKVTVNINGVDLKLEGEVDETVDFVQRLQKKEQEEKKIIVRSERIEKAVELNKVQFDLWEYLVDNDCEAGVPIAAVARHFELNEGCAGQRLSVLTNNGYAYRVGRGRYRAKEKD